MKDRPEAETERYRENGQGPADPESQEGLKWLMTFVARGSDRARALFVALIVGFTLVTGGIAYYSADGDAAGDGATIVAQREGAARAEGTEHLVGGSTGLDPKDAEDASEKADGQEGARRFVETLLGGKNPSVELADLALAGIGGEKLSESFSGKVDELARKEPSGENEFGRGAGDAERARVEEDDSNSLVAAAEGLYEDYVVPSREGAAATADAARPARGAASVRPSDRDGSGEAADAAPQLERGPEVTPTPPDSGAEEGALAATADPSTGPAARETASNGASPADDGIGASDQTVDETAAYMESGDEARLIAAVEDDVADKTGGDVDYADPADAPSETPGADPGPAPELASAPEQGPEQGFESSPEPAAEPAAQPPGSDSGGPPADGAQEDPIAQPPSSGGAEPSGGGEPGGEPGGGGEPVGGGDPPGLDPVGGGEPVGGGAPVDDGGGAASPGEPPSSGGDETGGGNENGGGDEAGGGDETGGNETGGDGGDQGTVLPDPGQGDGANGGTNPSPEDPSSEEPAPDQPEEPGPDAGPGETPDDPHPGDEHPENPAPTPADPAPTPDKPSPAPDGDGGHGPENPAPAPVPDASAPNPAPDGGGSGGPAAEAPPKPRGGEGDRPGDEEPTSKKQPDIASTRPEPAPTAEPPRPPSTASDGPEPPDPDGAAKGAPEQGPSRAAATAPQQEAAPEGALTVEAAPQGDAPPAQQPAPPRSQQQEEAPAQPQSASPQRDPQQIPGGSDVAEGSAAGAERPHGDASAAPVPPEGARAGGAEGQSGDGSGTATQAQTPQSVGGGTNAEPGQVLPAAPSDGAPTEDAGPRSQATSTSPIEAPEVDEPMFMITSNGDDRHTVSRLEPGRDPEVLAEGTPSLDEAKGIAEDHGATGPLLSPEEALAGAPADVPEGEEAPPADPPTNVFGDAGGIPDGGVDEASQEPAYPIAQEESPAPDPGSASSTVSAAHSQYDASGFGAPGLAEAASGYEDFVPGIGSPAPSEPSGTGDALDGAPSGLGGVARQPDPTAGSSQYEGPGGAAGPLAASAGQWGAAEDAMQQPQAGGLTGGPAGATPAPVEEEAPPVNGATTYGGPDGTGAAGGPVGTQPFGGYFGDQYGAAGAPDASGTDAVGTGVSGIDAGVPDAAGWEAPAPEPAGSETLGAGLEGWTGETGQDALGAQGGTPTGSSYGADAGPLGAEGTGNVADGSSYYVEPYYVDPSFAEPLYEEQVPTEPTVQAPAYVEPAYDPSAGGGTNGYVAPDPTGGAGFDGGAVAPAEPAPEVAPDLGAAPYDASGVPAVQPTTDGSTGGEGFSGGFVDPAPVTEPAAAPVTEPTAPSGGESTGGSVEPVVGSGGGPGSGDGGDD